MLLSCIDKLYVRLNVVELQEGQNTPGQKQAHLLGHLKRSLLCVAGQKVWVNCFQDDGGGLGAPPAWHSMQLGGNMGSQRTLNGLCQPPWGCFFAREFS